MTPEDYITPTTVTRNCLCSSQVKFGCRDMIDVTFDIMTHVIFERITGKSLFDKYWNCFP
jgi:hypothetical protein